MLLTLTVAAQIDRRTSEPAPAITVVEFGRLLFWDPILSGDKDVACASTTAMGKPSSTIHKTRLTVQSGSGIAGKITLAASSTTKETAPYTAITRKTRRRFISSSHRW